MLYQIYRDKESSNLNQWSKQEIECITCKRSHGCRSCSIKRDYNIKTCNMFYHVLNKFTRLGMPKEELVI